MSNDEVLSLRYSSVGHLTFNIASMIPSIISWSLKNRYIVLLMAIALLIWGFINVQKNPIDAIPDVSENQVIVFTEWMGRSPQIIEDQVTYPLVSNLQGIPK